jgi:hypothetical protein
MNTGDIVKDMGGPHDPVLMSIPNAVWNGGLSQMDLSWADPGDPNIVGYLVYRSDNGGANYNLIGGTVDPAVAGRWASAPETLERALTWIGGLTFSDTTGTLGEWYDYSIRYVYGPDVPTSTHDGQTVQPTFYAPVYSGDSVLTQYGGGSATTPPETNNLLGSNPPGGLLAGDHNNLDLTITADCDDNDGDNIDMAEFRVDGGAAQALAGAFPGDPVAVTGTFNPGVGYFAEGIHTLEAHAHDVNPADGWNATWAATTFNIVDTTDCTGLWLNTPGATLNKGIYTFRATYEDFTAIDLNPANTYIQFQINGGGWGANLAWTNQSFAWGTFTNILSYAFDSTALNDGDVVDYRAWLDDSGGGAPVPLAQGQTTILDAGATQDPYPVYGRVYLYDGTFGGGYAPILAGAGAPVAVTWINSTTGLPSTINTVTNIAGQFSVDILNYTDLTEINLVATFSGPANNGYNWTTIDVVGVPGGVEQDVVCGVPYDVQITAPLPAAVETASFPFPFNYQIVDRDGAIAQGYYTWAANPFDLLSNDPALIGFVPRTFDGTADATPGLDAQVITLFNGPAIWLNVSEGGAELPVPDNFLTPWGGFSVHINFAILDGWLKDYDNITVQVLVGGFDWDLQQGWNIVSLPQEPTLRVGANLFFDSEDALENCFLTTADPNMQLATRVLGTNPSTYTVYDYGTGEGSAFALDSVHGYWVYLAVAGPFVVHFDSINWSAPGSDTVACDAGWNLLGFTHNYITWTNIPTASDFTDGTIDVDFTTGGAAGNKIVATDWNQAPQWYNSYVTTTTFPGMPVHDWVWDTGYSGQPGNGFWLWIEVPASLTFPIAY